MQLQLNFNFDNYLSQQLLRKLLQRRLRHGSQDARHLSELLHPRDRGVPKAGPSGGYAAVLRAPEVLLDVADLLRPRQQHIQTRSTENGRRRVRVSLEHQQTSTSRRKPLFI